MRYSEKTLLDTIIACAEYGETHLSSYRLANLTDYTPQHIIRVCNGLVDSGHIRMVAVAHRPSHPIERFRYKSLYCLPENYIEQMESPI